MEQVAVFLAAVSPGLLMLAYGVAKTGIRWSSGALYAAVLAGAVGSIVPALMFGLEDLFRFEPTSLVGAALSGLFAAIPEQGFKFLILLGAIQRDVNVRRLQDIVALALGVSIGFAILENLFYLILSSDWQSLAIRRALLSVPSHGVDGLIMGALLTSARLRTPPRRTAYLIAFVIPVIMHASYDVPPLVLQQGHGPWVALVWFAVVLLSVVLAIGLCNRVLPRAAQADRLAGRDTAPPARGWHLIVGGCALIAAPVLGVLLLHLNEVSALGKGAVISIIPAALGIDLIWTGVRRQTLSAPVP